MNLSEAARAILLAAVALLGAAAWMAWRTLQVPVNAPDRLIAELRLAQLAALVLVFTGAAYVGLAAAHEQTPGAGLDVAFAVGFFVVAVTATLRDPREALTMLALAFAAHALVDVLHRPMLLPPDIAPRWYVVGCAIHNVCIGALCYLPVLRRA